jgi:hypothetical protein
MASLHSPTHLATAVHFCSTCDKPFTSGRILCASSPSSSNLRVRTEYSRDRHLRYCGSRTRNRPRSCRACNTSKTKCSFEAPCSRCTKKGIECVYNTSAAGRRSLPRLSGNIHEIGTRSQHGSSDSIANEVLHNHDGELFDAGFRFAESVAGIEAQVQLNVTNEFPTLDMITQNPSLDEFLALDGLLASEEIDIGHHQSIVEFSMAPYDQLDVWSQSWCGWMHRGVSLSGVTENIMARPKSNHATVAQRERPLAQHNADVVIQSLRAFPTMMLRRETFPWYIHRHSHMVSQFAKTALPEALSNCMSIAQLFALRTSETKVVLWRTIRAEYRRLNKDVCFTATFASLILHLKRSTKCPN